MSTLLSAVGVQEQAFTLPCQRPDSVDLFFAEQAPDLSRAKVLCAACPLKRECLAGALQRSEPWGVWGGEILVEGEVVKAKRGRGRPRKVA